MRIVGRIIETPAPEENKEIQGPEKEEEQEEEKKG